MYLVSWSALDVLNLYMPYLEKCPAEHVLELDACMFYSKQACLSIKSLQNVSLSTECVHIT